jgi:hypothetical protein
MDAAYPLLVKFLWWSRITGLALAMTLEVVKPAGSL